MTDAKQLIAISNLYGAADRVLGYVFGVPNPTEEAIERLWSEYDAARNEFHNSL